MTNGAAAEPETETRERGRKHHVARWIAIAILAALLGGVVAIGRAQPAPPGEFYAIPDPLPSGPLGAILKIEPLADLPGWVTGWKILYRSTSYDGSPTAVSAIAVVPNTPAPAGGRRVMAWAHPTTGVQPKCAPSLNDGAALPTLQGSTALLTAGYAIVATDYQGLGTASPHPYLIGAPEAMDVLDSVRALRNIPEANAGNRFVVFGHSQGGHAALFTGQMAKSYAPELDLLGVAAAAPATDLIKLFEKDDGHDAGSLLGAMATSSWVATTPGLTLDQIMDGDIEPIVRQVAGVCIEGKAQTLSALPGILALNKKFFRTKPWDVEPWRTELARNTPGGEPIPAPVLVMQGAADDLVWPDVTSAWVAARCATGENFEYREMPGVGHIPAGEAAAPTVVSWSNDRFDGTATTGNCAER